MARAGRAAKKKGIEVFSAYYPPFSFDGGGRGGRIDTKNRQTVYIEYHLVELHRSTISFGGLGHLRLTYSVEEG